MRKLETLKHLVFGNTVPARALLGWSVLAEAHPAEVQHLEVEYLHYVHSLPDIRT